MNQKNPDAPSKPARLGQLEAAAQRLDCSRDTVRRLVAAGELQAYRVGKRMIRVDMDEVEKLLRPIPAGGQSAA